MFNFVINNFVFNDIAKYLPILITLYALQLGLQIYSLIDLYRRETVRFNNKIMWLLIILFGGMLGSIGYLIFREEKSV
ncbi:MAG: PLDc N-terminal domain-containing protein [Clostridia bacterium]|jgi:hypothetical protein